MRPVSIGIRDAKINLSKLLKDVQKGAEIIITDRNKPVGRIVPVSAVEDLPPCRARSKHGERGLDPICKKEKGEKFTSSFAPAG